MQCLRADETCFTLGLASKSPGLGVVGGVEVEISGCRFQG